MTAYLRIHTIGFILILLIAAGTVEAQQDGGSAAGPVLGWIEEDTAAADGLPGASGDRERRLSTRLTARWDEIEREKGVYDWSRLDAAAAALREAGISPVVCLTGSNRLYLQEGAKPSPYAAGSVEAWSDFLRSAVRSLGGRVEIFEIWDGPADGNAAFAPEVYAFLLKNSALAIRAEAQAGGFTVRVAQGTLDAGALEWQRELWNADAAPYIDILPLRFRRLPGEGAVADTLTSLITAAVRHPPAPAIWLYLQPVGEGERWDPLPYAVEGLAASAEGVLIAAGDDAAVRELRTGWIAGMEEVFSAGFATAPADAVEFRDAAGTAVPGVRLAGRFFSDEDFTALLVYDASAVEVDRETVYAVVPSTFVRNARVIDPVTGKSRRTAARSVEYEEGVRSVRLPVRGYPVALVYQAGVVTPGFEVQEEELDIRRTRGLTAEEIIARFRELQEVQDDNLERWTAKARIDFHFKFAQTGSTVDVAIDSNYFWERGGDLEWEQTDYYVNGNKVTWKTIPELPLIQPEKVITLPLDLTLDKTYSYRLVGEDRVEGRETYVLAFEPGEEKESFSLYRGRVWIDKETFARLKATVMQTNLEAPVLSNEEVDRFRAETGPGGETYWLLDFIDGQQLWTAGGRNFVVRREVRFLSYDVNPPVSEFESSRSAAYTSNNQMLRDTDRGFRYLERQEDGSRTVKETVDTSQFLAAAGAFKDSSTDGVTPLAGVSYFNYDVAGKNIQLSALFGGVVGFFNATKPDLFGRKIDLTMDAVGVAIKFDDKVFSGDSELEAERIRQRTQALALRLGIPAGQFFKVTLVGGLTHRAFFEGDLELPNNLEFRLPPDHTVVSGSVQAEYNRRGYSVTASGTWSNRSEWSEWGLFDTGLDSYLTWDPESESYLPSDPAPQFDSFSKWGITAFKEWYLPKFQKIRGEVNYLDGSDLDRFSRYEFSLFGDDRLSGFAGSGVRFDRGFLLRTGYSFNLFDVIRLDATLENARVEENDSPIGSRSFTGVGISGNVIGPWKTVINLSYGRALASDIPDLEGEQEFLLFVLKLF